MVHVLKCLEGQDFWQHSCLLIPFCHVKLWYVHINNLLSPPFANICNLHCVFVLVLHLSITGVYKDSSEKICYRLLPHLDKRTQLKQLLYEKEGVDLLKDLYIFLNVYAILKDFSFLLSTKFTKNSKIPGQKFHQ